MGACSGKYYLVPPIKNPLFGVSERNKTYQGGGGYIQFMILYLLMYDHTYSKSKHQPGKVANPACGQLKRERNISPSAFAPENLVSREGFGSPVPRQLAHLHTLRLNLVLTHGGFIFPLQLTTSRIGNLTWLILTLAICVTIDA